MEMLEELRASRRVGYRAVDPRHSGWKDIGIGEAAKQKSNLARYNATMKFVTESIHLDILRTSKILDPGEYNPFSRWLNDELSLSVVNTPPDVDFDYVYL